MIKLFAGLFSLELITLLLMGCGEQRTNLVQNNYAEFLSNLQPGTYTMEVSSYDFRPEILMYRPYLTNYFGHWELNLKENGKFSANNNSLIFEGLYSTKPGEIIFYGTNWLSSCFFSEMADEVDYHWYNSGNKVVFTNLEDDCFERSMVLSINKWEFTGNAFGALQVSFNPVLVVS
jgi:hypothetical protein